MKTWRIPGTDLDVSMLSLGSAGWPASTVSDAQIALIDAYRDAGGNFFDTAHIYACWLPGGAGCAERALADYFRRRGGRDRCVVATKGGHPGWPGYRTVDHYMAPERVAADIDDSLGRLECETIDLYWLHRDDPRMGVGEIVEYLNREVKRGRIRWFGGSNWSAERLAEANQYAAAHGLQGFSASQPEWNLAQLNAGADPTLRFFDEADRRWHQRSGMPVMPYTPNAQGYFATAGQRGRERFDNPVSRQRLARARQLADELGRTPGQIALAYLMNHPFPVIPILGTGKPDHLAEAVAAAEIHLTAEQVRWLRDGLTSSS